MLEKFRTVFLFYKIVSFFDLLCTKCVCNPNRLVIIVLCSKKSQYNFKRVTCLKTHTYTTSATVVELLLLTRIRIIASPRRGRRPTAPSTYRWFRLRPFSISGLLPPLLTIVGGVSMPPLWLWLLWLPALSRSSVLSTRVSISSSSSLSA